MNTVCDTPQQLFRVQIYEKSVINDSLIRFFCFLWLQKHLHAVEHKYLALARLSDLIAFEQLELARSLVVVVLDADASPPFLDLPFGCPDANIHRLRPVEDEPCR